MAHTTGGGLEENLTRAVPHPPVLSQRCLGDAKAVQKDPKLGNISPTMLKVFNCGVVSA